MNILKILNRDYCPCICLDVFGIGALSQGIAGGVSAGLDYAAQRETNAVNMAMNTQTNSTNMLLAAQQNVFNKKMWDLSNEYNSPVAQKDRYLAAGINPITAMSNGGSNVAASNLQSADLANQVPGRVDSPHLDLSSIGSGIDTLLRNKELNIKNKQVDSEIEKNMSNIDYLKAQTRSLLDGNTRANEMQPYLIKDVASKISNINSDTDYKKALVSFQRAQSMSTYNGIEKNCVQLLQAADQLQQSRFSHIVSSKSLSLTALKIKADVVKMSNDALIDYANTVGVRRSKRVSGSVSKFSSSSFDVGGSLSVSGETPTLTKPVGQVSGSVSGDVRSSDSSSETYGSGSFESQDVLEITEDTIRDMQVASTILKRIMEDPGNVALSDALLKLRDYAGTYVPMVLETLRTAHSSFMKSAEPVSNPVHNSSDM